MLLSVLSVLVVAQSSSEVPEGLMNNPVLERKVIFQTFVTVQADHTDLRFPARRGRDGVDGLAVPEM